MKKIIKVFSILLIFLSLSSCGDEKKQETVVKYDVWIHPMPGVNKYVGRVRGMSGCTYYAKRVILGIKDKEMAKNATFTCCQFGSKEMCPKK